MWEMTIVGSSKDVVYFDELDRVLHSSDYAKYVMLSFESSGSESICSVACTIQDSVIVDYIRIEIVKTMLSIVKHEYFLANLHISSVSTGLLKFLVDVLVSVDSEYEVYYSISRLTSSKVYIRPFVRFCLKDIVNKWCRLTHTLIVELGDMKPHEIYMDILKFAVDMTSSIDGTVAIDVVDGHYVLLDDMGAILDNIPISADVDMIVRLINHHPRCIKLKNVSSLPDNVYAVFRYIFSDRLQVFI